MTTKTTKLYMNDSTLQSFNSQIVGIEIYDGKPAIVLKETVFYGEAGGQLADRGTLDWSEGHVTVTDVQVENGIFYHIVDSVPSDLNIGQQVSGTIDMERRRDHMRQHTGQHLVSAACSKLDGLNTISSRLGSRTSTIDINLDQPDWAFAERVETLVNQMIMENKPVHIQYPDTEKLSLMTLRRTPKVEDDIRVIEIEGFDLTPCGGTHCGTTGEVGLMKITNLERYKGMVRITFVAGQRALEAVQMASRNIRDVTRQTECQLLELPNLIHGIQGELKETRQNLGVLRKAYLVQIADQLLLKHPSKTGITVIPAIHENLDAPSRRVLAQLLSKRGDTIAVVASLDAKAGKWMMVLESSPMAEVDCQRAFKEFFFPLGGKGGGRPQHVEGFLPNRIDIHAVMSDFVRFTYSMLDAGS